MTCTQRCSTIVVTIDNHLDRVETLFVIRTYRSYENDQHILFGWLYAHLSTRSEKHRTNVQRSTCTIRRNKTLIGLNHLLDHVNKHIQRRYRHPQIVSRRGQTFAILIRTEDADLTIHTAESLQTLKSVLTIMQCRSSHVQTDHFV